MSTFIKGVNDQLGPMQLYRPDYQFLTQVYGTKQAEYDRGFNMVKSLYSSVLNSSVTNQDNQTFRQEAFKKLQGSLKSMSNVDLSNPTNIMRAQTMIDPISKDEDLAYDMAVTRFHAKQKQTMEQYRNSSDPKMRAMYNEYSRMDIGMAEEDLRSAKRGDGSIQKVQPREFTPFEDVNEYLRKAAKEEGLEIKQSGPDGRGYILTRTNGPGAVPIFNKWAAGVIGNKFDRQFNVIGRVNAENAIRSTMNTMKVSKEEATNIVASKLLPDINMSLATKGVAAQKEFTKLDEEVAFYEKQFANGFPASKPEIELEYKRLLQARDDYKADFEASRSEVARLQEEGPAYIASNLYGMYSQAAKDKTAMDFAAGYATAHQSQEVRPDTTWATKVSIASRERIAGAQLAMQRENLNFQKQKFGVETELKMIELKGKGYAQNEEYLGQGVSDKPSYASDMQNASFKQNREQVYQSSFNGENGLMKLVVNSDAEYSQYYSSIAKLKQIGAGQQVKLTAQDEANIKEYGKKLGKDILSIPKDAASANSFLDGLASFTFKKASDRLALYSKTHKSGQTEPYMASFQKAAGSFQNLVSQREQLNKDMLRISQEVLNPDGSIKDMYKGAIVRGSLGNGAYDIDLSKVSDAAKTRVSSMISGFKDRQNPVSYKYKFSKLSGAEVETIFKNPNAPSSVTTSDGSTLDASVLKNMNSNDLKEMFGDNANVFYDAANNQVKIELNVSQKDGLAKKLKVDGAQTLFVTIPYSTIQSSNGALSRFEKYIAPNTVNQTSLGVLSPFLTNPDATVLGEGYMKSMDFDYRVQGTTNASGARQLLFTYDYMNPVTGKTQSNSKYLPYTPGDPTSLQKVSELINQEFYNYRVSKAAYEKTIQ